MPWKLSPWVVVAALASLAGCVDGPEPSSGALDDTLADPVPDAPDTAGPQWQVSLGQCTMGSMVSVYGTQGLLGPGVPSPWVLADIADEIGQPALTSLGYPVLGETTGHWHTGVSCSDPETGAADGFQWGWVGVAVDPPTWDEGGADLHLLLAGFGLPEGEARNALMDVSTADISVSNHAFAMGTRPGPVVIEYDDATKGVYNGFGHLAPLRDIPADTVYRFWWTVPADGSRAAHDHGSEAAASDDAGGFHPVSWDLILGQTTQFAESDTTGVGCHTGTDHHGPQGGLCQTGLNTVYEMAGLDVVYRGTVEDVVLDSEWIH